MRLPTELRELFFQLSVEILSITNPLRIESPAGFYEVFNFPPRQGRPLATALIEKGQITEVELMGKLSGERTAYQALFQKGDGAH